MNTSRLLGLTTLYIQNFMPILAKRYLVVCKEYSPEDDDFVEVAPDEFVAILRDTNYRTFEVWRRR